MTVTGTTGYHLGGVALYPDQPPEPLSPGVQFPAPPFTIDRAAYASHLPYPATPNQLRPAVNLRNVTAGAVTISTAQFTPGTKELSVFTSIDYTVTFTGGGGVFGGSQLQSAWNGEWDAIYQQMLLNGTELTLGLTQQPAPPLCGEELLIVTDPNMAEAANQLATARNADGTLTRVVKVGDSGVGTTPTSIQSYVQSQFTNGCGVQPSYVLLFGDTKAVPTWLLSPPIYPSEENLPQATDQPYGFLHPGDTDAGLGVGRITSPDLKTAKGVVAKIVGYEDNPTSNTNYYHHATIANFYQDCPDLDCRTHPADGTPGKPETPNPKKESYCFLANTAVERGNLAGGDNITISEVTTLQDPTHDVPSTDCSGKPLLSGYSNDSMAVSHIEEQVNAGRFLIIHHDHGIGTGFGWAEPPVQISSVWAPGWTTAMAPVVFSLDCDSGKYDAPEAPIGANGVRQDGVAINSFGRSFAQFLLENSGGGAAAVLASSRVSFEPEVGQLSDGFTRAMYPPAVRTITGLLRRPPGIHRMGLILLKGNFFMQDQNGTVGHSSPFIQAVSHEFADFGDPSMAMWTAAPNRFSTEQVHVAILDAFRLQVTAPAGANAPDGTIVTVANGGTYFGRGQLKDGKAVISTSADLTTANATVILSKEGYVSAGLPTSPPVVTAVTPNNGVPGDAVTIIGSGFSFAKIQPTAGPYFGTHRADTFTVEDDNHITVTVPTGNGVVDVRVADSAGYSTVNPGDQFRYLGPVPNVTSESPRTGPTAGGTKVTILGTNFSPDNLVGEPAHALPATFVSSGEWDTVTPPGKSGHQIFIGVFRADGKGSGFDFTYVDPPVIDSVSPPAGPVSGGTSVTIGGTNLATVTDVSFGASHATSVVFHDDGTGHNQGTLTMVTPPGPAGVTDLKVTTTGGSTDAQFKYFAQPVVTSLQPNTGSGGGGEAVVIHGSGFTGATAVMFGSTPVTNPAVVDDAAINVVTPPGAAGPVDVQVSDPGGASAHTPNDLFTYQPFKP